MIVVYYPSIIVHLIPHLVKRVFFQLTGFIMMFGDLF